MTSPQRRSAKVRWLPLAAAVAATTVLGGCALEGTYTPPTSAEPAARDTECAAPTWVVTADWRPATTSEVRSFGWEFPAKSKVYVLPHVSIEFTNRSTEKIWIREAWISNKWIDADGAPSSSYYARSAGAYASVVPRPYSSSADNEAESVKAGDTIAFSRDWDAGGYRPDAEFADTNGTAPRTFVKPTAVSWWFDSPEHRDRCAARTTRPSPR